VFRRGEDNGPSAAEISRRSLPSVQLPALPFCRWILGNHYRVTSMLRLMPETTAQQYAGYLMHPLYR